MECRGTAYQAKKKTGVSVGRVYQIWREYQGTGKIPELGKNVGRIKRPILKSEKAIVKKAYEKYRLSASQLRRPIKRNFNVGISHYHMHKILLTLGFAKPKEKKDVRKKKGKRYESKIPCFFIEKQGIKHILCRIKRPQSKGKAEKFVHLYKVHRKAFKTLKQRYIN